MASDIRRYHYPGVFIDCDDTIEQGCVLRARKTDFLISAYRTPDGLLQNTPFASGIENKLRGAIIKEIELNAGEKRFRDLVDTARPYIDSDGVAYIMEGGKRVDGKEEIFDRYRRDVFDFAGPGLLSRVLRRERPDYVDAYITADIYPASLLPLKLISQSHADALNYYFPFLDRFRIKTANTGSWQHT